MNLTLDMLPDRAVVRIDEPRLDAAMALSFKERMREIVAQAPGLVQVDMAQVQFMDSSGLGALIAIHKALPGGTRMALSSVHANVMRVLRLTRMDTVFTIVERPEAAAAGTQGDDEAAQAPGRPPAPVAARDTAPDAAAAQAAGGAS